MTHTSYPVLSPAHLCQHLLLPASPRSYLHVSDFLLVTLLVEPNHPHEHASRIAEDNDFSLFFLLRQSEVPQEEKGPSSPLPFPDWMVIGPILCRPMAAPVGAWFQGPCQAQEIALNSSPHHLAYILCLPSSVLVSDDPSLPLHSAVIPSALENQETLVIPVCCRRKLSRAKNVNVFVHFKAQCLILVLLLGWTF